MSVRCPKCGGEEWTAIAKVTVEAVLSNDNEEGEERLEQDNTQTRRWECDNCGYKEDE